MSRRNDRLSGRQLGALALTAAGVPVFRFCCRVSWPWVLLGGLAAAATLSGLTVLAERRRQADRGGSWAALLLLPPLALGAGCAAWESGFAFPETARSPLAAAFVLGLALAALRLGPAAAGRCAGILVWITGALYGTVLLFSLPQLRTQWLRPAGTVGDAAAVWAALLPPGAALCLAGRLGEDQRLPHWPWWAAAALAAAASAVTGGILSPSLAREAEAFRTLARGVSVLGVIRRFEALVNGAQLMSGFCLCTLLLAAAEALWREIPRAKRTKTASEKKFEKNEKSVDKWQSRCYYMRARCGRGSAPNRAKKKVSKKRKKFLTNGTQRANI